MKNILTSMAASLALMAALTTQASEAKWLTSLPDAKAQAKAESKLVFVEFTGSDWCPPCKRLKANVLDSKAFAEYAARNFVLVELDFPSRKEQSAELKAANKALASQFKVESYPTVVILDADGKELHRKRGYGGQSPEEYLAEFKNLR
jgi:thioredoxin-related protein